MKNLFFSFFIASNAYAFCVPSQMVQKLGCELQPEVESVCQREYGQNYVGVKESGLCGPRGVSTEVKRLSTKSLMRQIESQSDEIDAILTMVDRKGIKGDFFNFEVMEVNTFDESHIKALLEKMQEIRENIYLHSASFSLIDSDAGRQSVVQAARYYSFMARIHQIMASAAHSQTGHQLSYHQLNSFTLKVDKRVGLELLARMNLKAKHLDSETLSFSVSEEEKQNFEFNVIQAPTTLSEYSKLVQFMSIREFLSNRWAMERISTAKLDNPKVSYCGPGMLSFTPGRDSTMGSSSISQELETFDNYFNRFPQLVDPLASETKKLSLLSASAASQLVKSVFSSLPSFKERLINEYGWTEEEVDSWREDISLTLQQNEDKEWASFAQSILSVSVFPGDGLDAKSIEDRIVEDVFRVRKEAIQTQIEYMMDDLTDAEKKKMKGVVSYFLDTRRATFQQALRPLLTPHLTSLKNDADFKKNNYKEKVSQTAEIAKLVLPSAYLTNYIVTKKLKKKLHSPKLKLNDLEIKNPTELIQYFQTRISGNSNTISYLMDSSEEHRQLIAGFFDSVSKRFNALSTKLKVHEYQAHLYQIAKEEAQVLFKKWPGPSQDEFFPRQMQERAQIQADNTRVATNPYIKVPLTGQINPEPVDKTQEDAHEINKSAFDSLSLARMHYAVADNTRVAINQKVIENKSEIKTVIVNREELNRLQDMSTFVTEFLGVLNLDREGRNRSFLSVLGDQEIVANMRLGLAYADAPLLRIPLVRTTTHTHVMVRDGASVTEERKDEKPSLIRMLTSMSIDNDGNHTVNPISLVSLVKETLNVATDNLKGQASTFCLADHRNPSGDKKYNDLFRSSTMIRMGILSNDALTEGASKRLQKLDDQLKKETRYWHEAINEDYIEPIMNVACVLLIITVFLIPMLGSSGVLAPGSVMLLMTFIDGVDLAFTGASLYFRSMSTFYEVPAQIKFQKALAYSQISNFSLTNWDDINAAQSTSKMSKTLSAAFTPFEAIVGGQFYYSMKKLLGITGKEALGKLGVTARGFGAPPKSLMTKPTLNAMIKKRGVVKGTLSHATNQVSSIKYWTPRYQPLTTSELANALRVGIITKAKQLGVASKPWELIGGLKSMASKIDRRLEINKVLEGVAGSGEVASMSGKMTWKEFINKPNYSKELLIPLGLMGAAKKGQLGRYLSEWGGVLESMNRLRGRLLYKRKKGIETLIAKLEDVQKISASNSPILKEMNLENWMQYFESLLSDEEIHFLSTIARTSQNAVLKEFKSVFKAHEQVLEGIVSFSSIEGRSLTKVTTAYGKAAANSEREDIKDLYLDMLENDGATHLDDKDILDFRKNIEDEVF